MSDLQHKADYLPARMLNEYVYCPRLFYYEYVDKLFAHNTETVEGALRHAKIDARNDALPEAEALAEADQTLHARSIMLSSDQHRLIAKIDVVEADGRRLTPIDYKRGRPCRDDDNTIDAWPADRYQLAAQALVLRENGYACDEGIIYYVATKQRVRVPMDEALLAETRRLTAEALHLAATGPLPPPLADSPKCPRCSLVGICLPDETRFCSESVVCSPRQVQLTLFDIGEPPQAATIAALPGRNDLRRLIPARDDLRPLYLNTQGLSVGKSGAVLQVRQRRQLLQQVRIGETSQVNLFGNIQLTTQAIQALCSAEVPIAYFSQGGWFYGLTRGLDLKNIFLRREQFRWAERPSFCLALARALVAGKIRNQRTLLQRNHVEPPRRALDLLKCYASDARQAESLPQLLGIEGNAARLYFENFAGMLKTQSDPADANGGADAPPLNFDFRRRNRRPPRDAVNALLSLAYSLLAKDLTIVCHTVGLDPFLGYYHQLRFGRAALALDLMEPFRPLIAESAVLTAINTRMVTAKDFIRVGPAVALTPNGRKAFFRAYEQRMDALVTHPLFGYRVNYRRLLEVQTRLLGRVLTGELRNYPVFTTR